MSGHRQPLLGPDATPVSALRTAWILWAALLASVAMYGVVLLVLPGDLVPDVDAGPLTTPLVVTGFFLAMAGGLVFRRIHRDMPTSSPSGQPPGGVDPARMRRALVMMLVAWALFEGAGVVGLVLALLGGKGWPLIALGAGLIAIHPPRRSFLDADMRSA